MPDPLDELLPPVELRQRPPLLVPVGDGWFYKLWHDEAAISASRRDQTVRLYEWCESKFSARDLDSGEPPPS